VLRRIDVDVAFPVTNKANARTLTQGRTIAAMYM
jgi:hypothetical protein